MLWCRKKLINDIKKNMLRLLKEDEEFRYAVAGYLGLSEILKKMSELEERMDKHFEELVKLREDMNELKKETNNLRMETNRLREDMNELKKETNLLREETNNLRMETNRLREDMMLGFEKLDRRISALGARWGIESESSFRNGLKGIIEKELNYKVEQIKVYDSEGIVYGYPSEIEIDLSVYNEKIILVEVSSHVRRSDVSAFKRKATLYEKLVKKKVDRLVFITPFIDESAKADCKKLGIEVYTNI
ncbi:MAG: DUF3782 domain-containing protein [Caldisphaeraceae archaeon]|nr:DUF3782 domain-containing protein [Caldisphaeraceae archaeon]